MAELFADPRVRDQLLPLVLDGAGAKATELMSKLPGLWEEQRHQSIGPDVISGPKGWMAPGALDSQVRSRVLDALEISAQLVFPTSRWSEFPRSENLDLLYGGTQALNRAMAAFCAPDPRLKAVGFLPLTDPERAVLALEEAINEGVAAVWVPSEAPGNFSPAHTDLDPVWARLAEAGVPFVLHVALPPIMARLVRSCNSVGAIICPRRSADTTPSISGDRKGVPARSSSRSIFLPKTLHGGSAR